MRVLAIHAHPDDIEFMMAGTMLLLKEQGCDLYYMTLANGSLGSAEYTQEETIQIRAKEAEGAAKFLGAQFIPSIVDDLEVYYNSDSISKVASIVREVQPDIMLVPSPQDYMEDHINTGRIAVTAAFTRGMKNYVCNPARESIDKDIAIYHAQPHYSRDALGSIIRPDFFVNVDSVMEEKREALGLHASQKNWLDFSQGFDSYIITMDGMMKEIGEMSGKFEFAEGWRKHSHIGFAREDRDPIRELLPKELIS